jgi:hypothetical protein
MLSAKAMFAPNDPIFGILFSMKMLFQAGLNGRVFLPPEKKFPSYQIHRVED